MWRDKTSQRQEHQRLSGNHPIPQLSLRGHKEKDMKSILMLFLLAIALAIVGAPAVASETP